MDRPVCQADSADAASFRDPAGYVFRRDGRVLRAVTPLGLAAYRQLVDSGLYDELAGAGLLVAHRELSPEAGHAATLEPDRIDPISYPYEWGFLQLQDAALLTLDIARRALLRGMELKDASAFNVQFNGARPVFIDTLSFAPHSGGPWLAYEQFCRHFLAPLALMSGVSPTANQALRLYLDGLHLDNVSRALPLRSWLRPGLLLHLHLHARAQSRASTQSPRRAGPARPEPLIDSLHGAVSSLKPRQSWSRWLAYRANASHYPPAAAAFKTAFVTDTLTAAAPGVVYDLGANTGEFARLAASLGARTVAFESDPFCVDACYATERASGRSNLLPLLMDVANPSSSAGVSLTERLSLFDRPQADLVLALALSHHLRLTANIPFDRLAAHLRLFGRALLIEFVEAADPMAAGLIAARSQPLPDDYSLGAFLAAFSRQFTLVRHAAIPGAARCLCYFKAKP